MARKRRTFSASQKSRIVLEAIKGDKTIAELSSQYSIHPVQISKWRKQAVEGLVDVFSRNKERKAEETEELLAQLYEQIGRLQFELEWLKKKSGLNT